MTDDLKLILTVAAAAGAMYGLVTRPLMALLKSEMKGLGLGFKLEIQSAKQELKAEMTAMEKRLNERIDAWVLRR